MGGSIGSGDESPNNFISRRRFGIPHELKAASHLPAHHLPVRTRESIFLHLAMEIHCLRAPPTFDDWKCQGLAVVADISVTVNDGGHKVLASEKKRDVFLPCHSF